LTITHEIAVRSEMRTDIQGTLRLGPLAPGGRDLKGSISVGPLAEMGLMRKPLQWELDGPLPCDLDGHFTQPVEFDAPEAGQFQLDAVLSIVQAPPALRPVVIDGDLSEWLPNEYNAAGDFRIITQASGADPNGGRCVSA